MPQPYGPSSHDFVRRGGSESRETEWNNECYYPGHTQWGGGGRLDEGGGGGF